MRAEECLRLLQSFLNGYTISDGGCKYTLAERSTRKNKVTMTKFVSSNYKVVVYIC